MFSFFKPKTRPEFRLPQNGWEWLRAGLICGAIAILALIYFSIIASKLWADSIFDALDAVTFGVGIVRRFFRDATPGIDHDFEAQMIAVSGVI